MLTSRILVIWSTTNNNFGLGIIVDQKMMIKILWSSFWGLWNNFRWVKHPEKGWEVFSTIYISGFPRLSCFILSTSTYKIQMNSPLCNETIRRTHLSHLLRLQVWKCKRRVTPSDVIVHTIAINNIMRATSKSTDKESHKCYWYFESWNPYKNVEKKRVKRVYFWPKFVLATFPVGSRIHTHV